MLNEEVALLVKWVRRIVLWGGGVYLGLWAIGFIWLALDH